MITLHSSYAPGRAVRALGKLFQNPDDLPQVFTIFESMTGPTVERMVKRLRRTGTGARLLDTRSDIVPVLRDREALRRLPNRSLGRAYLDFVESESISAEGIIAASVQGETHETVLAADVAWVHQRMRDTHDLWHVVTGYKGDLVGETALLGFTLAQTRNPGVALIYGLGLIKLRRHGSVQSVMRGGFDRGRKAEWLPAVDWEPLMALPIDLVRTRLHIVQPPAYAPIRSEHLKTPNVSHASSQGWTSLLQWT